ncbi:MAG: Asp-tRNA(Asn)/Glu-tRNA(Gln) amidotransferase subunit GatB [Acidobacteriota bacterium]
MEREAVIGLEAHVQLRTATKLFCRCPHRFGAPPNTLVCETCLGYPGALPVPNRAAVDQAVRLAVALGATVERRSAFDRKSYFYADLPKGYQITQERHPLARGGHLPLVDDTGQVRLRRLHLEEDAGRSIHADGEIQVDFNRAGVPLVEIVTEPELNSAAQARSALLGLHQVLRYTEASDGRMAEGSLRCDANISLRPRGATELGSRVEVKNLNSFRNVARAIEHEIERQGVILDAGGRVEQETRAWDERAGRTRPLRDKETARDYRFHPEPDLPPIEVDDARRHRLAAGLPELPRPRRMRFVSELGLDAQTAATLTRDRALADYVEAAIAADGDTDATAIGRFVAHVVVAEQSERGLRDDQLPDVVSPTRLAALVRAVADGTLSSTAAKQVLAALWGRDAEPLDIAASLGVLQERDDSALIEWARAAVTAHPMQAAEYRAGKTALLGFFVGRAMAESSGRADPRALGEHLRAVLAEEVDA